MLELKRGLDAKVFFLYFLYLSVLSPIILSKGNETIKLYVLGPLSLRNAFGYRQNDNSVIAHSGIYAGTSIRRYATDLLFSNSSRNRESYRGIKKTYRLL